MLPVAVLRTHVFKLKCCFGNNDQKEGHLKNLWNC